MVDSNFYVENSANNPMHYGDKPRVGVIDFPDRLPVKRPFNYFEAQALYNNLWVLKGFRKLLQNSSTNLHFLLQHLLIGYI